VAGRSRYRVYATQCVQLATDTTDEKRKLLLLEMARHWLELAEEAAANQKSVTSDQWSDANISL
jgi:hypothetical protein